MFKNTQDDIKNKTDCGFMNILLVINVVLDQQNDTFIESKVQSVHAYLFTISCYAIVCNINDML